jgi:hypothetical protein
MIPGPCAQRRRSESLGDVDVSGRWGCEEPTVACDAAVPRALGGWSRSATNTAAGELDCDGSLSDGGSDTFHGFGPGAWAKTAGARAEILSPGCVDRIAVGGPPPSSTAMHSWPARAATRETLPVIGNKEVPGTANASDVVVRIHRRSAANHLTIASASRRNECLGTAARGPSPCGRHASAVELLVSMTVWPQRSC